MAKPSSMKHPAATRSTSKQSTNLPSKMSKFTNRFKLADSDSEEESFSRPMSASVPAPRTSLPPPPPPSKARAVTPPAPEAEVVGCPLKARLEALCRANGLDRLFAAERHLDSVWSGTVVQTWRSDLLGERCLPEEDRLVMARPIGRVGVWGAIFEEDIEQMTASAAEDQRIHGAARAAADAAERDAYRRKNKVERVACREGATRTRNGPAEIRRLPQPCKFLYSCQGTPARPTTGHVSSECWSHESGVCPWAHPALPKRAAMRLADGTVVPAAEARPADPLWRSEWLKDRTFTPEAFTTSRFTALRGLPRTSGTRC